MRKELLVNNEESMTQIVNQIRSAQESIYICMYIWRDDKAGNLVAKELIAAADRGVEVKIIKDKAGSVFEKVEHEKQSFFHKQKEISLLIKEWLVSSLYYRDNDHSKKQITNEKLVQMLEHKNITVKFNRERYNHSKFFVFDNRVLILGGMNIGDKEGNNREEKYEDYMIKLVGSQLVSYFWSRLGGKQSADGYQGIDFYFNIREQNSYQIKPKVLELLEEAKYRVDIEMAYFGDQDITEKIIKICRQGVKVTIITSRNSNVQQALNQYVLQKLISKTGSNLKVYLSDRMVHSKFMCVDRDKFFLGSANFHKLGMRKLSELNVLVKNADKLYYKWKSWRKDHLQECTLISEEEKLSYNKLVALTEKVLC